MEGRISEVNERRGFGFIRADGESIWFHANELRDLEFDTSLRECWVSFRLTNGPQGPAAVNVRKLV